ncbi:MAG: alpha/beta fold hydrolase [Thermoanaerobaculia bacterium]|nr:alpha/beta fold hydrolase [Thermoanaerobaculia bacterium]
MRDTCSPAVVFLHGPSGRPSDFEGVAARIPGRFPVRAPYLSYERRGEAPFRELTDQLEREVGDDARDLVLVGSSLGGLVALAWAGRRGARVRGLVLSGCPDPRQQHGAVSFREVRAPSLLLWGTEDRVTPPDVGRRVRELLPGARLLFILEAGHAPAVERPAVFAFHLSSFLNDLSPRLRPPRRLVDEAA